MINYRFILISIIIFSALLYPMPAISQSGHGSGHSTSMEMQTRDVLVDDIKVSFAIMDNQAHLKMLREMKMKEDLDPGSTHNITVVLHDQKKRKEIEDAKVSIRIVRPGGGDEIKTLRYEAQMKSYDAYFTMSEKGRYQVLVLFRVADQKKTAGIYYDLP